MTIAQAGEIKFTFGLTRTIEACEEAGDRLRYRVGAQWYDAPKAEVQQIIGMTCSPRAISDQRQFDGFSIVPPRGGGWTTRTDPERHTPVSFSLGPPTPDRPHTVVAMVTQAYLAVPAQDRTQLMRRLIESIDREQWGQARFRHIAFETSEDRSIGADCLRYVAISEDRGVPGYPVGSVFILEVRGLRCAHPSDPQQLLDVSYSQRFPREQSWDPRFDAQVEPFLQSFTLTPLPLWQPARWERAIVAAKQTRERGDKIGAEQLCVDALQYVGTSVVRGLQGYASLLKSLKRDAQAAQERAEAFRRPKAQPGQGSVDLGFSPLGELQAYAALLREAGRGEEAEVVGALAKAYDRANYAHYRRAQEQARGAGGDWLGVCY